MRSDAGRVATMVRVDLGEIWRIDHARSRLTGIIVEHHFDSRTWTFEDEQYETSIAPANPCVGNIVGRDKYLIFFVCLGTIRHTCILDRLSSELLQKTRCTYWNFESKAVQPQRRVMDPERIEVLEAEIDRLIEKRANEENDLPTVEELWAKPAAIHEQRRRREIRAAWYAHHMGMYEIHSALASEHERKALELLKVSSEPGEVCS